MKKTVIFKIGTAEIKVEGGVPALSNMPQEGKDVMTINNAITALNKELGFDVQKQLPNIKDTACLESNNIKELHISDVEYKIQERMEELETKNNMESLIRLNELAILQGWLLNDETY